MQGHDQSVGYREYYKDERTKFSKQYYESRNQAIIYGSVQELKLFDEILHLPENCWSDTHKFLIYHHIFMHYKIKLHKIGMINDHPPSLFGIVEVNPGTGKYFVKAISEISLG